MSKDSYIDENHTVHSLFRYICLKAQQAVALHRRTHFAFSRISGATLKSLAPVEVCLLICLRSMYKIIYAKYIV